MSDTYDPRPKPPRHRTIGVDPYNSADPSPQLHNIDWDSTLVENVTLETSDTGSHRITT